MNRFNRIKLAIAVLPLFVINGSPCLSAASSHHVLPAKTAQSEKVSVNKLKVLDVMLQEYIDDNDFRYPPMQDALMLKRSLYAYSGNKETLTERNLGFYLPGTHTLYAPNAYLSKKNVNDIHTSGSMVVFYEPVVATDGTRAVSYYTPSTSAMHGGIWIVDLVEKRVSAKEWEMLKKSSLIP